MGEPVAFTCEAIHGQDEEQVLVWETDATLHPSESCPRSFDGRSITFQNMDMAGKSYGCLANSNGMKFFISAVVDMITNNSMTNQTECSSTLIITPLLSDHAPPIQPLNIICRTPGDGAYKSNQTMKYQVAGMIN